MEKTEERVLKQKELAKENIDISECFILLTDKDITGCASIVQSMELLVNGVRTLVEQGNIPKYLLEEMLGLIKADDVYKYMEDRRKQIESEEE